MIDEHRERCDAAFQFQGAASVAFTNIKSIAEKGYLFEGISEAMSSEQRLTAIAKYCDEMLAKLPADLREFAAKCAA